MEDKEYTRFKNVWENDNYEFLNNDSIRNDKGIYITVENKNLPNNTQGRYIEYYYIFESKESGFTKKSSL